MGNEQVCARHRDISNLTSTEGGSYRACASVPHQIPTHSFTITALSYISQIRECGDTYASANIGLQRRAGATHHRAAQTSTDALHLRTLALNKPLPGHTSSFRLSHACHMVHAVTC